MVVGSGKEGELVWLVVVWGIKGRARHVRRAYRRKRQRRAPVLHRPWWTATHSSSSSFSAPCPRAGGRGRNAHAAVGGWGSSVAPTAPLVSTGTDARGFALLLLPLTRQAVGRPWRAQTA